MTHATTKQATRSQFSEPISSMPEEILRTLLLQNTGTLDYFKIFFYFIYKQAKQSEMILNKVQITCHDGYLVNFLEEMTKKRTRKTELTPKTQWQERWCSHGDWWSYFPFEMPYRNLEWRTDKRTFTAAKKSKLSQRFPSYTQTREAMPPLTGNSEVEQEHSVPQHKTSIWMK